jgi:hypothetical protein
MPPEIDIVPASLRQKFDSPPLPWHQATDDALCRSPSRGHRVGGVVSDSRSPWTARIDRLEATATTTREATAASVPKCSRPCTLRTHWRRLSRSDHSVLGVIVLNDSAHARSGTISIGRATRARWGGS